MGVDDAFDAHEAQLLRIVHLCIAALADGELPKPAAMDIIEELSKNREESLGGGVHLRQEALDPTFLEVGDDCVAADDQFKSR